MENKYQNFFIRGMIVSILILIIAAGLLCFFKPFVLLSDSTSYLLGAESLSRNQGYTIFSSTIPHQRDPIILWPPAYSYTISKVMNLFHLESIRACRLLHFTCWIVFYISWVIFCSFLKKHSLFAWALILFCPFLVSFPTMIFTVKTELFYSTGLILAVLLLLFQNKTKCKKRRSVLIVVAAIMFGICALIRNVGITAIVASVLFLLVSNSKLPKKQQFIELVCFCFFSLFGPISWLIRNKFIGGYFNAQIERPIIWSWPLLIKGFTKFGSAGVGFPEKTALFGGFFIILICGLVIRRRMKSFLKRPEILWIFFYVVIYTGLLFALAATSKQNPESRYFELLVPWIQLVAVYLLCDGDYAFPSKIYWGRVVLAGCVLVSIITTGRQCIKNWNNMYDNQSSANPAEYVFEPFSRSKEIFVILETLKHDSRALIFSNFNNFLTFVSKSQILRLPENTNQLVNERKTAYFFLSKNNLWRHYLPSYSKLNNEISHVVLFEDEYSAVWKSQ